MEKESDSNAMEEHEEEEENDGMSKRDKSSEGFPSTLLLREQGKDGRSLNSPFPTMENLQTCPAHNLRVFLTRLRHLNERNLFSKAPMSNRLI
jgi:hypothetical protein